MAPSKNNKNTHFSSSKGGKSSEKSRPFHGKKPDRPTSPRQGGDQKHGAIKSHFSPSPRSANRDTHDKREVYSEKRESRAEKRENRDSVLLWGLHAVRAAWLNPARRCFRLWMTETMAETFASALEDSRAQGLARPNAKIVARSELDALLPADAVHQGLVLEAEPIEPPILENIIDSETAPQIIVVLDQVTDPHNVGAILRSAAAFGAGGVIVTERNAPATTGVMAKTACGAADMVPLIPVVNLARALQMLKKAGYWCIGLAEEGEKPLSAQDMKKGRIALVMGAEGEGLRRLTRETCDALARLPTCPPLGSLNVSNAAAIALYEVVRQRG